MHVRVDLLAYLEIDDTQSRKALESLEDDGSWIVPGATTELIVRRACELHTEETLREVKKEEAKKSRWKRLTAAG